MRRPQGHSSTNSSAVRPARSRTPAWSIVSDYLKGAVTRNLVAALVEGAQARKVPVLVDPKIPHIDYYAGDDRGHAEPPRGGNGDAHADPHRR